MGIHYDHIVHNRVILSLWLDSPISGHPYTKACPPTPSRLFQVPLEKEVGYDMQTRRDIQERLNIEVKLLSANRKSYMPCRLAQQRMTLSDLECLILTTSASRIISLVAELLVWTLCEVTYLTCL